MNIYDQIRTKNERLRLLQFALFVTAVNLNCSATSLLLRCRFLLPLTWVRMTSTLFLLPLSFQSSFLVFDSSFQTAAPQDGLTGSEEKCHLLAFPTHDLTDRHDCPVLLRLSSWLPATDTLIRIGTPDLLMRVKVFSAAPHMIPCK